MHESRSGIKEEMKERRKGGNSDEEGKEKE